MSLLPPAALAQTPGLECNGQCFAVADSGGANGGDDLLVTYEPTGNAVPVGTGTGTEDIEAMTLGLDGVTMFALNADELGTIDYMNTGTFQAIGSIGSGTATNENGMLETVLMDDLDGMAFDPLDGRLFAVQRRELPNQRPDLLVQINPNTGALVPNAFGPNTDYVVIEPTGSGRDIDGLAISPIDGIMYGIANENGPDELVTIDKVTGATTTIGTFVPGLIIDAEGITFNPAGDMTIVTGVRPSPFSNSSLSVDLATGAATLDFAFPLGTDYESSSCLFCPGNLISGRVVVDCDDSGSIDPGERPAAGVTVNLVRDLDMNGVIDLAAGDLLVGSRVTDASGTYDFEIITAGDFIVEIDQTTLPAGSALTSVDLHVVSFPTGVGGLTDTDNDFLTTGFPVLTLGKSATPTGPVTPGDTITYTLTAENIAAQTLTTVEINDALPAGVTLVPGSVSVNAPVVATTLAEDDFNSSAYTDGSGWASDWSETGDDGSAGGGVIAIAADGAETVLSFTGDASLTRTVDLSTATSAELRFDMRREGLLAGQNVMILADNGSGPVGLFSIIGPATDAAYVPVAVDLSAFAGNSVDLILTSSGIAGSSVFIDDVEVEGSNRNPSMVAGGTPPLLFSQADLEPGELITVTFDVTVDDPPPASIDNTALAIAAEACDPVEASATVSVDTPPPPPPDDQPGISITKAVYQGHDGGASCATATASETAPLNTAITYCFTVENTGDTLLSNTVVDDPMIADFATLVQPSDTIATMNPGDIIVLFLETSLDAALTNVASVTTEPPTGPPLGTNSPPVVVTPLDSGISITKGVYEGHDGGASCSTAVANESAPLDTSITYCFTVENTGGTVLDNVVVTDSMIPSFATLVQPFDTIATLNPRDSITLFLETTLTAALTNVAAVTAEPPTGPPLGTNSPPVVVTPLVTSYTFDKGVYSGHDGGAGCPGSERYDGAVGEAITYCFLVENTGEVPLATLVVSDPLIPDFAALAQPSDTITGLAPGASALVFVETMLMSNVVNIAELTVTPTTNGFPITTNSPPAVVTAGTPGLMLTASGICGEAGCDGAGGLTELQARIGDTVTFCYRIENTGDTTLVNIELTDLPVSATPITGGTLAPGEVIHVGFPVQVTEDLTGNPIVTADSAIDPAQPPTTSIRETATGPSVSLTIAMPGINLVKSIYVGHDGGAGCVSAGDAVTVVPGTPITYCFLIENTGDVPLNGVRLEDAELDPPLSQTFATMAPGDEVTWFVEVTAEEDLVNLATVTARSSLQEGTCLPDESDVDSAELDIAFAGLGDFVWRDTNGNGIQDETNTGVPNVGVTLLDASGTTIDTTTTDASGFYAFNNLPLGTYAVRFDLATIPAGYVVTLMGDGTTPNDDSDADPTSGETPQVTLAESGSFNPSLDMGLVLPHELGNFVWFDRNNNGVFDSGESPIPNVIVNLYEDTDGDNTLSTDDVALGSQLTDANGNYRFTGLFPGDYVVQIDGANFSGTGALVGHLPSDPVSDPDNDIDDDNNGAASSIVANGALAQAVTLSFQGEPTTERDDSAGDAQSNLTVDFGFYTPVNIGNLVWHDLNNNGQYEPGLGESGIDGVSVELLSGGSVIASTATTGGGLYEFDDLKPGPYGIRIPIPPTATPISSGTSIVPGNIDFTSQTDNQTDNDDNGLQSGPGAPVTSPTIILWSKSEPTNDGDGSDGDLTVDFGFYAGVALGDYVWLDENFDGEQGEEEPPVPDVTVRLTNPSNGAVLSTMSTDTNGFYLFTNLPPANYQIVFDLSSLPEHHAPTLRDAVADDVDSDADVQNGFTPFVSLPVSGDSDLTIDMGVVKLGRIQGTVWNDTNGDGRPENENLLALGLSDVRVELFQLVDGFNQFIEVQTTALLSGNTGFYAFDDLYPGETYIVRVRTEDLTLMDPRPSTALEVVEFVEACETDVINFGFLETPTAIELVSFGATQVDEGVIVSWTTAWEENTLGFNVYRYNLDGTRTQVNPNLVLSEGQGTYSIFDSNPGAILYELEEVTSELTSEVHSLVDITREAKPVEGETLMLSTNEDVIDVVVPEGWDNVFAFGFSSAPMAYDITNPAQPVRLLGETIDNRAIYLSVPEGTRLFLVPAPE